VEVHIAELGDDEVEDVRLTHLVDFGVELEEIKDSAHVGREPYNVPRKLDR
jgi:hypothetical protein